jgi:hypothetical protein
MIDYFIPANTPEEEILRRIKGNYRRLFISQSMRSISNCSMSKPSFWGINRT